MNTTSTILAVASPPGRSLRGIVRISGDAAVDVLRPHLTGVWDADRSSVTRGMHRGRLCLPGLEVPLLALVAPGPRSYTGQDSVELQVAGHPGLLERIIDGLIDSAQGRGLEARRAEAGEFTARAFFTGRMTLLEAEGVAAVVRARSDAELRAARLLTTGSFGALARGLADELATALALVEAGIDFTDQEDVVPIAPARLNERLDRVADRIDASLARRVGIEQIEAIPWVVLTGPANAGKSTLFNALLDRERALVSSVPGTTRDVLTEPLTLETEHGPGEVMLVDLAGADLLEDSCPPASTLGGRMRAAAESAVDRAELELACSPVDGEIPDVRPGAVLVRTKCDLPRRSGAAGVTAGAGHLEVSAVTGAGVDALRRMIAQRLAHRAVSLAADAVVLRPRHEAALRTAQESLAAARGLVTPHRDEHCLPQPELVAASMRTALDALADLAGDITPDDVLGRIFGEFCVGK